jgi:hypothetical protein
MLVILMDSQLLSPQCVCQSCLLADRSGQPRWREGQLCCGREISRLDKHLPEQYTCQMGFRIANIE